MSSEKKVKNFLYTRSYVRKRLCENGFSARPLPMRYGPSDERYWSMLVDLGGRNLNLVLTCLRSGIRERSGDFSIMGPKCLSFRVVTKSMDVLVENLRNLAEEGGQG